MQTRYQYPINVLSSILYVREGEGDQGGAGGAGGQGDQGGSGAQVTPEIQKLIDAAIAEQTKGLKAKNEELLGDQRKLKDKLKTFDGIDPAKVAELQARLDQDEDAKLFAEGKKEHVIQKYTERMRENHQKELDAAGLKIKAAEERAAKYQMAVLDNHIRAACKDLFPGAVEDALLHARQIFSLDEEGNAVKLDAEGNPELGKNGKTPFSPAEWIEQQKELKPHWFPANTSGSGSGNARQGSGNATGKTMKRSDFEGLSPYDQAKIIKNGTKIVD